ncbi:plasmid segregation protein ParM domain-containing protein, partial [Escherichia coli]|nr:plasmid segregation protein parM [Escherichia coli]
MNVYCDDGSTTIKLAWNDNGKICKSLSQNSFRHGWKVDGLGIRQTFNYELDGKKYTYDEVSNQSISGIGVSSVTKAAMSALRMASSDTSFLVADELIKRRNDPDFVRQVINDETKT